MCIFKILFNVTFSLQHRCSFSTPYWKAVHGPVSQKSRKLFGPEKPFVKLRPAYSVKLVFSYVLKGMKIKITAKFRALRRLRFEYTKRIMSPEMRQKSFGTFEKQPPCFRRWFTSKNAYVYLSDQIYLYRLLGSNMHAFLCFVCLFFVNWFKENSDILFPASFWFSVCSIRVDM